VDARCSCYTCRTFTRSYLHHLFAVDEPLGATLASLHNLAFYQALMGGIRTAIEQNRLADFTARFLDRYRRSGGRGTGGRRRAGRGRRSGRD